MKSQKRKYRLFFKRSTVYVGRLYSYVFLKIKPVPRLIDKFIHGILRIVFTLASRFSPLRKISQKAFRLTHSYHRTTSAIVAGVFLLSVSVPAIQIISFNRQYSLSEEARTLLGESNSALTKKITYDEKSQLYQFNRDAKNDSSAEGNPLAKLQSQIGGAGEEDEQQHSIDIPRDFSQGVTYYDNKKELSFKLVPGFAAKLGGLTEGHLIYPLTEAKGQVAYTVTNSGLKENIVLYKSPGKTFKTSYYLDLPKSLEARLISETGEVGIYSADPTLFGNISYGSSDDQARVENARNNSEKKYLTFKIPAPVVMGLNGNDQSTVAPVESSFSLQNNTLTVTTIGLDKADYPLAIDPSVSIDSSTDFSTGNQEDNNSSIDSGSLNRSNLSGGTVGGWTNNATNMPASIYYHSSVAYNGYLYTIAGSAVRYAPISGDGSIGSWTSAPNLTGGQYYSGAVAYNGYLYVIGGGTTPSDSVRSAKINSNGSLNSWQPTTGLPNGKSGHQVVAYNGYIYAIGGREAPSFSAQTFDHTGTPQAYTVPAGVTSVIIDANGASGDPTGFPNGAPGNGGRVQTTLAVTPGQTLFVLVGGQGGSGGGFNGGNGVNRKGGGGSDVRQGGSALSDRKVVAGGGGSGGLQGLGSAWAGGHGGYPNGTNYSSPSGSAGTQSAGGSAGPCTSPCVVPATAGSLGQGGQSGRDPSGDAGGGGGGYYGGGGGGIVSGSRGGGGGGSSYAGSGTSDTTYTTGYRTGNGQVIITPQVTPQATDSVYYAPVNADGTVGAWSSTSSFTNAREDHQALAYNGYMYILGGKIGGTQYSDVQYAPINPDGTIGSWTATASFTTGRSLYSAVVTRGYIYIFGGNTSNLSDVQYAPINPDGTIGSWNSSTAFNTGRYGHTSVAYNGYIYIIGGTGGSGVGDKIQYATIDSPGSITSYKSLNNFAPLGRTEAGVVAYNGYLYIVGGWGSGLPVETLYAPINPDGTVGAWGTTSSIINGGRHALAVVAYNGMLYAIGGTADSSANWKNDVQRATVNATNGTLGVWTNTYGYMPAGRYGHTASMHNGKIYVTGGAISGVTQSNTVYIGTLDSSGTSITWTTSPNTLPTAVRYASSAVYGGRLYVVGGLGASGPQASIAYAKIADNGTLDAWSTSVMSDARWNHSMVISRGFMYVMGGMKGSGSTPSAETIRSTINTATGAPASWQSLSSIVAARGGVKAVEYNGYIFVAGGRVDSTYYSDVQSAQINNGGGGNANTWTNGTSFTNARYNHATVAYNNYLYIIGGLSGSSGTRYADVQKAFINENGSLGSWSSGGASLPTARNHIAATVNKGKIYVLGGKDDSGLLSEVRRATIDPSTGNVGSWVAENSFSGAREATATAVYNDYLYIIGGHDAGPQTTTFNYTGSQQTYTVPAGVNSVKIEAKGAAGGGAGYLSYDVGGEGATANADLPVTPSETLYVQVGGNGNAGGYNGGGAGGYDSYSQTNYGGGGSSDVRQGGTALANRKIIAGGGGGASGNSSYSYYSAYGGGGGDQYYSGDGGDGSSGYCGPGTGATDTAGGLGGWIYVFGDTEEEGTPGGLGVGGDGGDASSSTAGGGGGGGGYYGGGGGGGWKVLGGCGGGGGSSYVDSGASNVEVYAGSDGSYNYYPEEDGSVSITYGKPTLNDVQVAKINSDGTLGAWSTTTDIGEGRTWHSAITTNGYMYIVGGSNAVNITYSSVKYAKINNDGTLGAWQNTSALSGTRQNHSLAVVNGYMYAFGGWKIGAGYLNTVDYAPIHSDGTLGNWQLTKSMNSVRNNEAQNGVAYNGRLYATGGHNGTSTLNTTEYTTVQSIPRKTSYSKVIDLGTAGNITGLSYSGDVSSAIKLRYKVAGANGAFGEYKSAGQYSCTEVDAGKYVQVFVTLDDSGNSSFRDSDGMKSVLDSVTVDFVPFVAPTEKRLRHGAFFQNETLQPFNTNNTQCSA